MDTASKIHVTSHSSAIPLKVFKNPISFLTSKITSSFWFLLPPSTVSDTGLPPERCPKFSSLKLRWAVNSAFMSLSGQFGPNHFKREPRRREMKPTQGRQQILSTVAQRLSRSLLETGSIIAYSLSCCLDIAGIHIHLVEGKNTQNDTHVNMYAW